MEECKVCDGTGRELVDGGVGFTGDRCAACGGNGEITDAPRSPGGLWIRVGPDSLELPSNNPPKEIRSK